MSGHGVVNATPGISPRTILIALPLGVALWVLIVMAAVHADTLGTLIAAVSAIEVGGAAALVLVAEAM
jgi:hypothetical protein